MTNGIIRKIDNLGRFVVPTEIRKKMKINYNSPLEIYIDKENIVLRKVSEMSDVYFVAPKYIESLSVIMNKCIILFCNKEIFFSSSKQILVGKKISDELKNIIENKKKLNVSNSDPNFIEIIDKNKNNNIRYELILPIISQGESYGAIIILSKNKIGELENKLSQVAALFLGKLII
ncbi:MAG: stage V sporulation protein T [Clostridiales bacterium]|jgi:stage V sporulation protein T|nr:stage V sporulation protein T [Clostridiales bacterium]